MLAEDSVWKCMEMRQESGSCVEWSGKVRRTEEEEEEEEVRRGLSEWKGQSRESGGA